MQTFPKDITAQVGGFFELALDTILPPRCALSGEAVDRQGMIVAKAWADLDFIADPMCETCGFPFEFEVEKGSLCTSCLSHPPPFEQVRCALKYNDASRQLILGFKHADKIHNVLAFVPWMRRAGADMLAQADMLMPVPLHRWRLIGRHYNQAAIIAQALSRDTGVKHLPAGLKRVRATPSQGYLKAKERHKNVKRAFAVNPRYMAAVKGKHIVLIDDVYTTGATVKECTKTLLKAGAGRVDVLTLARVVRSDF